MAKEIECKMCPFECKKGKHMLVGDEPGERVSIEINTVSEKLYPVTPKPDGKPIVAKAYENIMEPPCPKPDRELPDSRTIYTHGICEVSGYSVGLTAQNKE